MKRIINILGLPASGKSFYCRELAEKKGFKFLTENATKLIHEKGYKIGVNAPLEFDADVLKMNKQSMEDIFSSRTKGTIILEGGPVLDMFYLEGRIKFGNKRMERRRILNQYEDPIFSRLFENATFIILDVSPEISMKRQKERNMPELITSEIELLKFVHNKLLEFYERNKNKAILIDASKSKAEVLKKLVELKFK